MASTCEVECMTRLRAIWNHDSANHQTTTQPESQKRRRRRDQRPTGDDEERTPTEPKEEMQSTRLQYASAKKPETRRNRNDNLSLRKIPHRTFQHTQSDRLSALSILLPPPLLQSSLRPTSAVGFVVLRLVLPLRIHSRSFIAEIAEINEYSTRIWMVRDGNPPSNLEILPK